MTTLLLEPTTQTKDKPVTPLRGLFVVFATFERAWITEPRPIADFAFVPVPDSADVWNSRRVTVEVTTDGIAQRTFFIDADGQLHAEGAFVGSRVHVCKGDSLTFLEKQFRLSGFKL